MPRKGHKTGCTCTACRRVDKVGGNGFLTLGQRVRVVDGFKLDNGPYLPVGTLLTIGEHATQKDGTESYKFMYGNRVGEPITYWAKAINIEKV